MIEVPKIAAQSLERDGPNVVLRFVAEGSHELVRVMLTPDQVAILQYGLAREIFSGYELKPSASKNLAIWKAQYTL